MTDSGYHLALATAFLIAGLACLLLTRRVAAWLRNKAWLKGQPDFMVKAYHCVSTEKGIRWLGVFLVGGALLQLWASWIMRAKF